MTIVLILLALEILLRLFLEIRERRLTKLPGGIFSILRLIPLVNDILPLPESRRELSENAFIKFHEEGHKNLRHSLLRNLAKIALLMIGVWFFTYLLNEMNFFGAILTLHLAAIPFKILFNLYCWNQEYEADRYAFKKLGKQKSKSALKDLCAKEFPYTKLFAAIYREHPTAASRTYKLLQKKI